MIDAFFGSRCIPETKYILLRQGPRSIVRNVLEDLCAFGFHGLSRIRIGEMADDTAKVLASLPAKLWRALAVSLALSASDLSLGHIASKVEQSTLRIESV